MATWRESSSDKNGLAYTASILSAVVSADSALVCAQAAAAVLVRNRASVATLLDVDECIINSGIECQ